MIVYKDRFKIKINGETYKEGTKEFFDLQELRKIYEEQIYHSFNTLEIKYDPIFVEDILSPEEIYGFNDNDNDYEEEEDYED